MIDPGAGSPVDTIYRRFREELAEAAPWGEEVAAAVVARVAGERAPREGDLLDLFRRAGEQQS